MQEIDSLKEIENKVVRVVLTNNIRRYIFTVELGVVEKVWGGNLRWAQGLKFKAVLNKLMKRDFKVERVQVLKEF